MALTTRGCFAATAFRLTPRGRQLKVVVSVFKQKSVPLLLCCCYVFFFVCFFKVKKNLKTLRHDCFLNEAIHFSECWELQSSNCACASTLAGCAGPVLSCGCNLSAQVLQEHIKEMKVMGIRHLATSYRL